MNLTSGAIDCKISPATIKIKPSMLHIIVITPITIMAFVFMWILAQEKDFEEDTSDD